MPDTYSQHNLAIVEELRRQDEQKLYDELIAEGYQEWIDGQSPVNCRKWGLPLLGKIMYRPSTVKQTDPAAVRGDSSLIPHPSSLSMDWGFDLDHHCPECGSIDTDRIESNSLAPSITIVKRQCDNCEHVWTVGLITNQK